MPDTRKCISLWILIIIPLLGFSQVESRDTTKAKRVRILHADEILFEKKEGGVEQVLRGDVALFQDSTFFYCDSAIVFNNSVWAKGNIQILQGDSTSIFSDSLYYSGDEKKAQLHGEVALINKDNELYTDQLTYDLVEKQASYYERAYLQRSSTKINSVRGNYWLDEHTAVFADSVVVLDTNFVLRADTLKFNTLSQTAYFLGPTSIQQNENRIYCESGFYDFYTGKAEFSRNAAFKNGDQRGSADMITYDDSTGIITLIGNARIREGDQLVRGDSLVYFQREGRAEIHGNGYFEDSTRQLSASTIFYNENNNSLRTEGRSSFSDEDIILKADYLDYKDSTGNGQAIGHVIWQDTSNDLAIFSDELYYNKKTEYVKAIGARPYMIVIMDGDTMYIGGDTLMSERWTRLSNDSVPQVDTFRRIRIYNDVTIFKSDLQGKCDSLVYTDRDSAFVLIDQPLLWSDTSQFSGDTIKVFLKNRTVDYVDQVARAMIINSNDLIYYNQIQGKFIRTFFRDGNPHETDVEGNAQSIYFALDEEDAYIAANKSICSKIRVFFRNRKIDEIKFLTQPKAEMLPMNTPGLQNIRLDGFVWSYDLRPKSKEDVIR
ncbi:MAG: OstA-like protein [Saprospiraceae bacterium]|nr:OstA-like protein [Saprospiraceae bacterium]